MNEVKKIGEPVVALSTEATMTVGHVMGSSMREYGRVGIRYYTVDSAQTADTHEYPFGDVYGVGDLTKEITLSPGVEHALAHQYGQEASKYQADLRIGSIRLELEAMQQE